MSGGRVHAAGVVIGSGAPSAPPERWSVGMRNRFIVPPPGAGSGDDDARPRIDSDLSLEVLAERLRAALRKVDQQLSPPAEHPSLQPRHGENDVSMRDGRKHLLLQPIERVAFDNAAERRRAWR